MLQQELAKLDVIEVSEKHPLVYIDCFFPSTGFGFVMYLRATHADYRTFMTTLFEKGLEPSIQRFRKGDPLWEFEIWVDVPERWQRTA